MCMKHAKEQLGLEDQNDRLRVFALAECLGLEDDEIEAVKLSDFEPQDGSYLSLDKQEYLVLLDKEADEHCKEEIMQSLWAFNPNFLVMGMGLEVEAEEMIRFFANKKCEDANEVFAKMLKDEDEFVNKAIEADGRGHFLSKYDGAEHEVIVDDVLFFIYRIN